MTASGRCVPGSSQIRYTTLEAYTYLSGDDKTKRRATAPAQNASAARPALAGRTAGCFKEPMTLRPVPPRTTRPRTFTRLAWSLPLAAICALAAWPQEGCEATSSGIEGISCAQDNDCNGGLKCLDFEVPSDAGIDAGCTSLGKECLQPCVASTDCQADAGLVCFASCEGPAACEPAGYQGIPGDAGVATESGTDP
jgi:hypothetical protein